MEKKTMGGFLAALRKANGMTQRELAERLNVSDKSVSRWERDDGAPDLSLIPVIAEIFDVSCDELLRGERKSPAQRADGAEAGEMTAKAEKQRQRLLKAARMQYRNQTCIAVGISVVGMIAALVCNLAFLKAVLGFFLGAVFFAAGIVCQLVFVNKAFFRVEDSELDEETLAGFRRDVIALAERSVGVTVAFVGFTFPLVLVDAFLGLGADSLLLWGTLGAAAFLLAYAVVLYVVNGRMVKSGALPLSERAAEVYWHNRRWKGICAWCLAAALAVTGVGHHAATAIWQPYTIMEGITFEDYDSFVAFMEQDVPSSSSVSNTPGTTAVEEPAPDGEITWYDEFGNEITEEEAMTSRLTDKNGNVVCEYIRRRNVVSIRYTPKDGTILPITVFTDEALQQARQTAAERHVLFCAAYCVECLAALLFYLKKREK